MNDDFDDLVGADRALLKDEEYLKSIGLRQAISLILRFMLDDYEKQEFLTLFLSMHSDKTMEELIQEDGIIYGD